MLRRNPSGKYLPNIVIPTLVTLLASGLWHGINPHYLFWEFLTGLVLVIERIVTLKKPKTHRTKKNFPLLGKAIYGLGIMWLISLFVGPPFLLEIPETFQFWTHLFIWNSAKLLGLKYTLKPILAIILSFAIDYGQFGANDDIFFTKWPLWARSLSLALVLIILFLVTRTAIDTQFIYQEF